jgi:glutathione S-transferase
LTEDFKKINPFSLVPAIKFSDNVKKDFFLSESHAILRFLSGIYHTEEIWYPRQNLYRKAKIDQYLDYHHLNVRFILTNKFRESVLKVTSTFGLNRKIYEIDQNMIDDLFKKLEKVLSAQKFIVDDQISIADLSLACELNQFYILKYNFDSHPSLSRYLREMNSMIEMKDVNEIITKFSNKFFNFQVITKL